MNTVDAPTMVRLTAQSAGAQFFRADLHIHSFGGSHDVKDSGMTPEAIVATAIKEGLAMVAIADHNEIVNVARAIAVAGTQLIVIPATELSTQQGHLLCYLPTFDALNKFYSAIDIADRGKDTSRCKNSLIECLNRLHTLGGFGILAHVDVPSGFEVENPGGTPHKADVLSHSGLLAIEIRKANTPISYSDVDPDSDRARFGQQRIAALKLGSRQFLARVLNSDAHALSALGRNAANQTRVTRYKMETPSFDGLRVALEEADTRVRIEEDIPQAIPRILGFVMEGGFLADQALHLSANLNCIIGGRGTGKSTAFEAIRCLAAGTSTSKVVDSEVWPDELHLYWQDQAGQVHALIRRKDCALESVDSSVPGPHTFDIDCFGQGEAARVSAEAQSNPLALLQYLDRFVTLVRARRDEDVATERLLPLQKEIEALESQVAQIPQVERLLTLTRSQLEALRKPGVKELIELQRHLATERELRTQIMNKVAEARKAISARSAKTVIDEIEGLGDPSKLSVGAAEFSGVITGAQTFGSHIADAQTKVKTGLAAFETVVEAQFGTWKTKETAAQTKIDEKRRELDEKRIPFDMSYIGKLTKTEAESVQLLNSLKTLKPQLVNKQSERLKAVQERWAARDRVATLRDAFGSRATATLRESLTDLDVSLKYDRNSYSPEATEIVIKTMGWRTNQQPRASRLVEDMTVPKLLEALESKNIEAFTDLTTPEGVPLFDSQEAEQIIEKLGARDVRFSLERQPIHDLPRLKVTRSIPDGKGGTRRLIRDFSRLSLGQQQSVLLALILSADTNIPLIIDQPEDNLDGQFIYSTLVPVLRRAKERRQVVIVTHNPNVAILGDAELIVVMKAKSDKGEITTRGSIDHEDTRDAACAILEGAREAFVRRARMYGMRLVDSEP